HQHHALAVYPLYFCGLLDPSHNPSVTNHDLAGGLGAAESVRCAKRGVSARGRGTLHRSGGNELGWPNLAKNGCTNSGVLLAIAEKDGGGVRRDSACCDRRQPRRHMVQG